tara:strand:+ start:1682 stop:2785 length:1104 start_codon:yes stop_codon:yes gene_type:complete
MAFIGLFDNFRNTGGPKGNLGDFKHAARLYVDNNMRLAPKFKFLYHVVLNINPSIVYNPLQSNTLKREVNILAKAVDLPQFRIGTSVVNQYNRKKIVQTGVDYQPISLEFHDDNAGLTTLLWETYFRYYFNDSNFTSRNTDGTPALDVDSYKKVANGLNRSYGNFEDNGYRYGLDRSNKKQNFFTSIQVFQLSPQGANSTFTSFTLINPIIESFQHDNLTQEGSELSSNKLTIAYESVQYARGYTKKGISPTGFGEDHYDQQPSPLGLDRSARLGGAITIAGLNNDTPQSKNLQLANNITQIGFGLSAINNTFNASGNNKILTTLGNIGNAASAIGQLGTSIISLGNLSFPSAANSVKQTSTNFKLF